jgi:hypothetical protein
MKTIFKRVPFAATLCGLAVLLGLTGCRVKYSLSGASIHENVKTVSIPFTPNSSTYVSPQLSQMFTDALREKFANQTKLELITDGITEGDMAFFPEITRTAATATAITAADEFAAAKMRLMVDVKVRFVNNVQPEYNFERTFQQYSDFDSNITLQAAENDHLPVIIKALVDDIFNAAVQNW